MGVLYLKEARRKYDRVSQAKNASFFDSLGDTCIKDASPDLIALYAAKLGLVVVSENKFSSTESYIENLSRDRDELREALFLAERQVKEAGSVIKSLQAPLKESTTRPIAPYTEDDLVKIVAACKSAKLEKELFDSLYLKLEPGIEKHITGNQVLSTFITGDLKGISMRGPGETSVTQFDTQWVDTLPTIEPTPTRYFSDACMGSRPEPRPTEESRSERIYPF